MTEKYNIVVQQDESTVMAHYTAKTAEQTAYQSEAALEAAFIAQLQKQGYEYVPIRTEAELIGNLRTQLEKLNHIALSDGEWKRLFSRYIANENQTLEDKTGRIQHDPVVSLELDNGDAKNIRLLDKTDIYANSLQVMNQYCPEGGTTENRYDVTILVNGLPLVHIELKRRGVPIREAFNQIDRYQRDSFWASSGLYEYVQIFVISNGTNTKYYSNTTRFNHIKDTARGTKKGKTSNSFEFTSFWADAKNKVIPDLADFAKTFFAKYTLLNVLTRYCVFTSENMLLVMRPYQIAATERILNRIEISHNYKWYGSVKGGGYIWHTTGSGKTLTSFKTAQLATRLSYIDKVLFVVDRKDLDYQTMKEYDRFEKGAANSNTSTAILKRQLEDSNARIIITTIQKLSTFIKKNAGHPVADKQIVIIFDECHRSQFGDMHLAITKFFKQYYLFGFTGTPIFAVNAGVSKCPTLRTTAQAFGEQLHTYTIVDAINDKNVLPFRVDYIKTMEKEPEIDDKEVWDIDRERAYLAPERIEKAVEYILDHFDQKTKRNERAYSFRQLVNVSEVAHAKNGSDVEEIRNKTHIKGFNSIFAVSSVEAAKLYYTEFQKQMAAHPEKAIKIATIYSFAPNESEVDGLLGEEDSDSTSGLDTSSRDFLEGAIRECNEYFGTNYDTSAEKFPNYYKDVSLRMKNKDIDLLIVVNMFLTGFDATTLNTLWVDKNLKMHGLIQAYSRTNRILNSIKTFGNIVCFRNLQKRTDEAIALFGDRNAGGIVLMRGFKDYYYGYKDEKGLYHPGYADMIGELTQKFPVEEARIEGETAQKEFIILFGAILRMRNLLTSFDDFAEKELLSERDLQDYLGKYQDLRDEWKARHREGDKEDITDDVVFEVELIKQIEINIDYILLLVKKYHDSHGDDKEVLITIHKAIDASPELRSKKALIDNFIDGINEVSDVLGEWHEYVAQEREKQLCEIIKEENLHPEETHKFIENSFRDGGIKTTGTEIDKIMPSVSRFGGGREKKKRTIIEKLKVFFERFFGIG